MDDTSAADTQSTYDITNKRGGVLIRFATKANAQNIQYVCHESTHAAMEIFDYIGGRIDCSNQEPSCYLVGWISECIKEALNYRTKKYKFPSCPLLLKCPSKSLQQRLIKRI